MSIVFVLHEDYKASPTDWGGQFYSFLGFCKLVHHNKTQLQYDTSIPLEKKNYRPYRLNVNIERYYGEIRTIF